MWSPFMDHLPPDESKMVMCVGDQFSFSFRWAQKFIKNSLDS